MAVRESIDQMLDLVAKATSGAWFRRVELVGDERIPRGRPLLVVASHYNGMLDPVLVARVLPGIPRFLAKATLWRNPVAGRLLDLVGALPVRRSTEGSTTANSEIFEACYAALKRGDAVALFPEGITHDEPRIAELRTGAARIALGARAAGVAGLVIVPMGLIYTAKASPRSRALIRVGRPIDLEEDLSRFVEDGGDEGPDNAEAVRRLTTELRDRLADAALDYDDADLALAALTAARIAARPAGSPLSFEPALDEVERLARALVEAPAPAQLAVISALSLYVDELALLDLTDGELVAGDHDPAALRFHLGRLAAYAAATPGAAVGMVVNGPAAGIVWAAGRLPLSPPMRGTARMLTGMVVHPASWVGLRWWLKRRGWSEPTLAALAAGPAGGMLAISLIERLRALRSARAGYAVLREHAAVLPALTTSRERLLEAVDAAVR